MVQTWIRIKMRQILLSKTVLMSMKISHPLKHILFLWHQRKILFCIKWILSSKPCSPLEQVRHCCYRLNLLLKCSILIKLSRGFMWVFPIHNLHSVSLNLALLVCRAGLVVLDSAMYRSSFRTGQHLQHKYYWSATQTVICAHILEIR